MMSETTNIFYFIAMNFRKPIMKKTFITTAVLLLSSNVFAQYTGPSHQAPAMTVQQLKSAPDDTYATIVGNILSHTGGDHYVFSDKTGKINVDIDHHRLPQGKFDANTKVSLSGKLDKEWNEPTEFDVKEMRIIP